MFGIYFIPVRGLLLYPGYPEQAFMYIVLASTNSYFLTEFRGPLTQCKRLGFLLLLSKIVYLEWPLIPPRTILNIIKMVPDYLIS